MQQTRGVVKQITVEELFGSSLPKDPTHEPSLRDSFLCGMNCGPPSLPLEPLLTSHLSANPFLPQHSISPVLMASSGSESFQALSRHCGPTGPQAPPYINPLKNDSHGISKPVAVPGFLPSSLVTPQSFQEPTPKVSTAFTSVNATAGQVRQC